MYKTAEQIADEVLGKLVYQDNLEKIAAALYSGFYGNSEKTASLFGGVDADLWHISKRVEERMGPNGTLRDLERAANQLESAFKAHRKIHNAAPKGDWYVPIHSRGHELLGYYAGNNARVRTFLAPHMKVRGGNLLRSLGKVL